MGSLLMRTAGDGSKLSEYKKTMLAQEMATAYAPVHPARLQSIYSVHVSACLDNTCEKAAQHRANPRYAVGALSYRQDSVFCALG